MTLGKRIALVFSVALLGLAALGFSSWHDVEGLVRATGWLTHTYSVLADLERVLSALREGESAQRAHLLTGDPKPLDRYRAFARETDEALARFQAATADNPTQRANSTRLEQLIHQRIAAMDSMVQLRRESGLPAVIERLHTSQSHQLMQDIRDLAAHMRSEEEALAARREVAAAQSAHRTLAWGLVELLGLAGFMVLSALWMNRTVTVRLQRVIAAIEAMGESGYDAAQVTVRGHDEVAQLAQAFNDMALKRRSVEEQLVHTKEVAEAAAKELEAFSYSVSHDLRAPLRAIDGFSQALLEDYAAHVDEAGRDHLSRVRAATQRMGQLIDDLLDLSRVSRVPLSRAAVDLSALARFVAAGLRETAPQRDVRFEIAEGLRVHADKRLLSLVLENLLGNAFKFTSKVERAVICVGARPASAEGEGAGGGPVYFVRDNGAGFDMAHTDKLFGAFQRLHAAREFEGTGIGLATVQRVIARHGGKIWADARPGEGATFSFTLGSTAPSGSPIS